MLNAHEVGRNKTVLLIHLLILSVIGHRVCCSREDNRRVIDVASFFFFFFHREAGK